MVAPGRHGGEVGQGGRLGVGPRLLGVSLAATRNLDTLFYAADIAGEPSEIVWYVPRNRETAKRFNPIDHSVRIVSLAASPVEPLLAVRAGTSGLAGASALAVA